MTCFAFLRGLKRKQLQLATKLDCCSHVDEEAVLNNSNLQASLSKSKTRFAVVRLQHEGSLDLRALERHSVKALSREYKTLL